MQLAVAFDSWLERFWSAFVDKLIEEIKIGDIGEHINEGILQWKKYFNIGGHEFVITDAIIVMVIATIIMIVLFKFLTGKESVRPNKKQTMMWFLYDLLINTAMGFGMNRKEAEKVQYIHRVIVALNFRLNVHHSCRVVNAHGRADSVILVPASVRRAEDCPVVCVSRRFE